MSGRDDNDEFWKIALDTSNCQNSHFLDGDNDDDDDADDNITKEECRTMAISSSTDDNFFPQNIIGKRYKLYLLNCPTLFSKERPIEVILAPLPQTDGVWSSLGSDAWYGSALLSALLISSDATTSRIHQHFQYLLSIFDCNMSITALEIGSGAVGLSSFALICSLARKKEKLNFNTSVESRVNRIIVTDNDVDVVRNLERNIRTNLNKISVVYSNVEFPSVQVATLDWNDGLDGLSYSGPATSDISTTLPPIPMIHLAIGSELVYTNETANACINIVKCLLQRSQHILIVIVQVTDREGWLNTFLPTIRQMCINTPTYKMVFEDKVVNASRLHLAASKLLPTGGTLSPILDYSVCYIWNYTADTTMDVE
jgi:hypothetical protein